jgi:hypothetical protein
MVGFDCDEFKVEFKADFRHPAFHLPATGDLLPRDTIGNYVFETLVDNGLMFPAGTEVFVSRDDGSHRPGFNPLSERGRNVGKHRTGDPLGYYWMNLSNLKPVRLLDPMPTTEKLPATADELRRDTLKDYVFEIMCNHYSFRTGDELILRSDDGSHSPSFTKLANRGKTDITSSEWHYTSLSNLTPIRRL